MLYAICSSVCNSRDTEADTQWNASNMQGARLHLQCYAVLRQYAALLALNLPEQLQAEGWQQAQQVLGPLPRRHCWGR